MSGAKVESTGAERQQHNSPEELHAFIATGRTGRRNAVPDISDDPNAAVTTSDLVEKLQRVLSTNTNPTGIGCGNCLNNCSCDPSSSQNDCNCRCHRPPETSASSSSAGNKPD